MKKLSKWKGFLGKAGLSMVELIISMAILAVVGTAVGGAMYVSSRSYTRGSSEVNVQEEAQVASNLICDWIMDAQYVTVSDGGSKLIITHPDDELGELTITIQRVGTQLTYTYDHPVDGLQSGVLAENVIGCLFDSTFDTDRNVKISLDFSVNDRTYHAVTDSTSRNHDFISTSGDPVGVKPAIEFDIPQIGGEYYVYLEPGQNSSHNSDDGTKVASFTFTAMLYSCDPDNTEFHMLEASGTEVDYIDGGDSTMKMERIAGTNKWKVTCTSTDNADSDFAYMFVAHNSNGNADPKTVTIRIRRATGLSCGVSEAIYSSGGTGAGTNGAIYEAVEFNLPVTNNDSHITAAYDNGIYGYNDASQVQFFYRMRNDADTAWVDATSYVDTTATVYSLSGTPSIAIKLRDDLDKDLYVVAVATHSGSLSATNTTSFNIGVDPVNRATSISGHNFSYGDGGMAYYASFVVKKPSDPHYDPWDFPGYGISRNTPSFEIGHPNSEFVDWLETYLYGLGYTYNQVHNQFNYFTSFKFKEYVNPGVYGSYEYNSADFAGIPDSQSYVVYRTNQWTLLKSSTGGHQFVQCYSDYSGRYEGYFFELDKAYIVEVTFSVYDQNGNFVIARSGGTEVPAATPRIYDTNTQQFLTGTYDGSDQAHFYKHDYIAGDGNTAREFYVYFDSVCEKNNRYVTFTVQEYHGPTDANGYPTAAGEAVASNWTDVTYNFSNGGNYRIETVESTFYDSANNTNIGQVRIPSPTLENPHHYDSYDIQNYDENAYPDYGVMCEKITFFNSAQFLEGHNYRISFDSTFRYVPQSNINYGSLGDCTHDVNSVIGSVTGGIGGVKTDKVFHLSNPDTNSGYIYVHGV